ncbi:hypothetical protein GLU60_01550 [Nanohaloarchaea archaeon H01]|jgi:hypothetical protein|nr:hypothetical protein [Nanohaloarchaea archaeon H01]
MPKLSVKPVSNREESRTEIYSLQTEDYHEKVKEFEGSGTVELEEGDYKVKCFDGDQAFDKAVLLKNNLSVKMDFSERFDREKKSGKKFLEKELVVAVIILALILGLYFTGNADFILDLI